MSWPPIAWRTWLPVALLVAWEMLAAASLLNVLFFPPPSAIARSAWALAQSGELGDHLNATLARTLLGFLLGSVVGLGVGLLMGRSHRFRWSVEPMVSALVSLPKLSLLPLLMLVLGLGERPRVALTAAAAFVVAAFQTFDAIRAINTDHVELARNYGATSARLIRLVYLPSALPQILTGLRLALGRALAVAVSVEIVGAPYGLGHLIWSGWQTFAIEEIYVGVFAAALLSVAFHAGMRGLEKVLVPWRS